MMIVTNFFNDIGVSPARKQSKSSGAHGASIATVKNLFPFSIHNTYLS